MTMMRTIRNSLLVVTTVGLAGCAGFNGPKIGGITLPSAQQVSDAIKATCGILPTVEMVDGIIGSMAGAGAIVITANAAADLFCRQFVASAARGNGAPPVFVINGKAVPISGRIVNQNTYQAYVLTHGRAGRRR